MKFLSFIFKIALCCALLFTILFLVLAGTLQTQKGQQWVKTQLLSHLEKETHTAIALESIELIFPFQIRLKNLQFSNVQGPLLSIAELNLSCTLPELTKQRVICPFIHAKGVTFDIGMKHILSQAEKHEDDHIYTLPIYLNFKHLKIEDLSVSSRLITALPITQPAVSQLLARAIFQLEGNMSHKPSKQQMNLHLQVTIEDRAKQLPYFYLTIEADQDQLLTTLHFSQFPLNTLNFTPQSLQNCLVDVSYTGSAPLKTWLALLKEEQKTNDPLKGELHCSLSSFDLNSNPLISLFDSQTLLNASYLYYPEGELHISDGSIENSLASLKGHSIVNLNQRTHNLVFNGEWHQLEALKPWITKDLKGSVSFIGNLQGSLQNPQLFLQLNSQTVEIDQQPLQHIHSTIQASLLPTSIEGYFQSAFTYQKHPFQTQFNFVVNAPIVSISELHLSGLNTSLTGQLDIDSIHSGMQGRIQGQIQELALLSPFLPIPLQGQATIDLNGDSHSKTFSGRFKGTNIVWNDWKIGSLNVYADRQAQTDHPFTTIHLEAQKLSFKDLFLESCIYSSEINLDDLSSAPFELTLNTKAQNPLHTQFKGKWTWLSNDAWQIAIHRMQGSWGPHLFSSKNSFNLDSSPDQFYLSALQLALGTATLQLEGTLSQEKISCQCQGDHLSSDLFNSIFPDLPLSGTISFDSQLEGPLHQPKANLHLILQSIRPIEEIFASTPPLDGELHLNLTHDRMDFRGLFQGIGKTPINTEGFIPLKWSLNPLDFQIDKQQPIDFLAQAEGELDPFLHLFYNDTTQLTGQGKIEVHVQGSLAHPQIGGQIDLFNGVYESFSTGAIYKDIQARLEGAGSQLVLKNFSARDEKNGLITGEGSINLDSLQHYPFEVNIHPQHVSMMDSDFMTIAVSGHLLLKGNKQQAKLEGNLTVDQATIRIGEAKPNPIKSIDFTYVNVPEGQTVPQYTQAQENEWPVELDITIDAASNLAITGKNVESTWKGQVILTGSTNSVLLNGDLRVVKGGYNLNGKTFAFTQGNIHFAGPVSKKTTLYVVASREIDRITAEVIVKGPINNPVFSFRSNPPLSEREVLSYILFNRGISDITTDQGNQLTQSFMTLNTESSNTGDLLSRLRNNIGIDRLDFSGGDSSDSNDFSLQVGKYISPGVLVSINKSLNAAANRVSIEADVHKNVKAQAEMGDDGQGKVSLKWKKSY